MPRHRGRSLAHLSGLTTDEAVYLQSTTHVSIRGLLLAGMVIGALGVLGDTTVTQASTVIALRRANPSPGWTALVTHATSVGRDHIAATVNTLVLAYTGAASAPSTSTRIKAPLSQAPAR